MPIASLISKQLPNALTACSKITKGIGSAASTCEKVSGSLNNINSAVKNIDELAQAPKTIIMGFNNARKSVSEANAQIKIYKEVGLFPSKERIAEAKIESLMQQIFANGQLDNLQRVPTTYNFLPQKLLSEEPLVLQRDELQKLLLTTDPKKKPFKKRIDGGERIKIRIGTLSNKNKVSILEYFKKGNTTEPYAKQHILFLPQSGVFPATIKEDCLINGVRKKTNFIGGNIIENYLQS